MSAVVHATVVHAAGGRVVTVLVPRADTTTTVAGETAQPPSDPSPLTIAPKELYWSLGSFLVLLALMRLVFYPKLRTGMQARQDAISQRLADAASTKQAAQADVADYEAALGQVRLEAQARVDAAIRTVEAERSVKMAEVAAVIARRRSESAVELDAAKAAVSGDISQAAREVVTAAAQHVLGAAPDAAALDTAIDAALGAEVS